MRTSCRFAMAVHVLAVLAYKRGGTATSEFLASSVNTHPVVIRRLLLALQEGKLVATSKGARCGSRLNRPPERITLADVLRAVDPEEPFVRPPRKPNPDRPVGQCIETVLEKVFAAAQGALEKELEKSTLGDLLDMIQSACSRGNKGSR
jgi:Rrf2 family protein